MNEKDDGNGESLPHRISLDEFMALTSRWDRFTAELMDGIPYIGGQPVDPDAFRAAMALLRQAPKTQP